MTHCDPFPQFKQAARHGQWRGRSQSVHQACLAAALVVALGAAASGFAANLAANGTGILGVNNAIDADAGMPRFHVGTAANLNDNNLGTRVDNWFGDGGGDQGQSVSFVGIVWPELVYDQITNVTLTLATFLDGGWFGVANRGPGAGGTLTSNYLVAPAVQVSTNGGVTWVTVSHTSDYMTVMNGHRIGGGPIPNPSSRTSVFTLAPAVTKINGVRIIGTNGGTADGNGFIGVFEVAVHAEIVEDSDGDGMPDDWERTYDLLVGIDDSGEDVDGDGLNNLQELRAGTDPSQTDSDGDGLVDGDEVLFFLTNPAVADSDGDGLPDGDELNVHNTDPNLADSDTDGLTDGQEVGTYQSDPLVADTDGDGFSDGLEVNQGSDPNNPNNYPDNLALIGTATMGTKESLDSGADTPFFQGGVLANINDTILATRVDTWNNLTPGTVSYVGIVWAQALAEPVVTLELTLATFLDGGWFGANNAGPGAGGALTATHLREPVIQTSTDGGASWSTVAHTSDYLSALEGHRIGGGSVPNPSSVTAKFTLDEPAVDINAIRIIGTEGGTASGGFLGVFELATRTVVSDSDNDGMNDAWERLHGLIVGADDSAEDPDQDELSNVNEFIKESDPNVADTDGDGLTDGAEVNQYLTNPLRADTDGDGLTDSAEVNTHHTDPLAIDTDGDGFADGLELAQGSDPTSAASFPENQALIGSAIMGTKDTLDGGVETPFFQAGTLGNINDGNLDTRVDTWNNTTAGTVSYVGVQWSQVLTNPVVGLELTLATFFDGGWFGVNNAGPAAGGALDESYLTEPLIQVSADGGLSWTTVSHSSDYLTALSGHRIGGGGLANPTSATAKFTLDEPAAEIDGIRLIGTEGGTASGGFLGVFELRALTVVRDSDGDGMNDAWERLHGLTVGVDDAAGDLDADGLPNGEEYGAGTDPQVADSDADGLEDGAEVHQYQTNPLQSDTDADGLSDAAEVNTHHTNPLANDSDADGFGDAMEVAQGSNPNSAGSLPQNFALIGAGILGTKESLETGAEVPVFNAGSAANINDGNLETRVDTWNDTAVSTVSFVGIVWDEPLTNYPIVSLELSLAIFFDGGWFGVNNVGPGSGATLSAAAHLAEPAVQVTSDGGLNWTTIGCTSEYLTALEGHPLPAVDFGPPTLARASFLLDEPQLEINGIRLIGTEGGTASAGFLGVFELAALADVPQPVALINVTAANGQFRFEFDTQAGASHVVQYKNALSEAEWQTLTTIPGDGTRQQVTDTIAGGQRFYRVMNE